MVDSGKGLLLHIGITKTGSSYLQSCAALNQAFLSERGIDYPPLGVSEAFFANARKGIVTGGNGAMITQHISNGAEEELQTLLTIAFSRLSQANNTNSTLVSNEGLCNNVFAHSHRLSLLADCAYRAGYSYLKCLLIVRNPYEHMCSWYLEGLKGTGWAAFTTIEEYAEKYNDFPVITNAISNMNDLGIEFRCLNYSTTRNGLLSLFLQWAGISDQDTCTSLVTPAKPVNRSLDTVEQVICQALAEHGIKPALFASNLLNSELVTNSLPSGTPTDSIPFVSSEALEALETKNRAYVDVVNNYLPAPDHIVFDRNYFPCSQADQLVVSREQLRSVVATFARLLDQHTTSKPWRISKES